MLLDYGWPGNVRQLDRQSNAPSFVRRRQITPDDLPSELRQESETAATGASSCRPKHQLRRSRKEPDLQAMDQTDTTSESGEASRSDVPHLAVSAEKFGIKKLKAKTEGKRGRGIMMRNFRFLIGVARLCCVPQRMLETGDECGTGCLSKVNARILG